jgi:hypothetical protein
MTSKKAISGGQCLGKYSRSVHDRELLTLWNDRYSKENFPRILELVDKVAEIGKKYNNATPGQVALAWLLQQGDDIIPIPGTKSTKVRRPIYVCHLVLHIDIVWDPVSRGEPRRVAPQTSTRRRR